MKKHKPLGGQAIIEGVMIKSPDKVSMAARKPDGTIVSKSMHHVSATQRSKLWGLPFVRGCVQLGEMMVIGIKALTWSAEQQEDGEEELGTWEWVFAFGLAIVLTVGLFILLPYYASKFFFAPETLAFGVLDGFVRLLIFLGYLVVIGFMKDIKRMFQYHGAEHMSVHCYEADLPLKVENVAKYPPEHPRCGTSLLIFVVAVSIIVFSVVRSPHWYINLGARVVLVPVIAGISYELLKFSAKYKWLKWLTLPGIWTQKLTTRQPDAKQIEVAIAAVNKAK